MEAKDTVMTPEELTVIWNERCDGFEVAKRIAETQAEISFKAGIREVVELINKIGVSSHIKTMEGAIDVIELVKRPWQAKLKEWGIE